MERVHTLEIADQPTTLLDVTSLEIFDSNDTTESQSTPTVKKIKSKRSSSHSSHHKKELNRERDFLTSNDLSTHSSQKLKEEEQEPPLTTTETQPLPQSDDTVTSPHLEIDLTRPIRKKKKKSVRRHHSPSSHPVTPMTQVNPYPNDSPLTVNSKDIVSRKSLRSTSPYQEYSSPHLPPTQNSTGHKSSKHGSRISGKSRLGPIPLDPSSWEYQMIQVVKVSPFFLFAKFFCESSQVIRITQISLTLFLLGGVF